MERSTGVEPDILGDETGEVHCQLQEEGEENGGRAEDYRPRRIANFCRKTPGSPEYWTMLPSGC